MLSLFSLYVQLAEDQEMPSALAAAMPSFVTLGLIMPEGIDAIALNKAASEAESHAAASSGNLSSMSLFWYCFEKCWFLTSQSGQQQPFFLLKKVDKSNS